MCDETFDQPDLFKRYINEDVFDCEICQKSRFFLFYFYLFQSFDFISLFSDVDEWLVEELKGIEI